MIPLESVAVASCLVILLTGCYQTPRAAGDADELTVTHVADGDTLAGVDAAGQRVRVRLLGIDAPELAHAGEPGECGATDARRELEQLVLHQVITLTDDPRAHRIDRYGRRLAYVDVAGVDVALHQLEAGYAAAWYPRGEPRPARHASYRDAQQAARRADAGAWASCPRIGR